MSRLKRDFFEKNTLKVAQDLLGKYLVRQVGRRKLLGRIVETEAYRGHNDLASHASRGKTPRTEMMFSRAGVAYIYLIYGMYYMFNIVTEKKDYPAAILIRAVEIFPEGSVPHQWRGTDPRLASGPGKLCRYFKIDKNLNGENLCLSSKLWIDNRGEKIKNSRIIVTKRIGVDYAKHCKDHLWRFYIKDNPFVSKL